LAAATIRPEYAPARITESINTDFPGRRHRSTSNHRLPNRDPVNLQPARGSTPIAAPTQHPSASHVAATHFVIVFIVNNAP